MHGFAHDVVAAEREADVAHAAAHLGPRAFLLDLPGRLDEVDGVVIVLFYARGDCKNVGVEDNILRSEAHFLGENAVGTLTNFHFAFRGIGLALLVKSHDDGSCAVTPYELSLLNEGLLAFFHGNGIHDAPALHALQPRLDNRKLRGVDHNRQLGDLGFRHYQMEKLYHSLLGVEQPFVHIDVNDLRPVFHLLLCHAQRFVEFAVLDEAGKLAGTGDVGAFPHVDEIGFRAYDQGLEAA